MIVKKILVSSYSPNKQALDIIDKPNGNPLYSVNEKIISKGKRGCEIIMSAFSFTETNRPIFCLMMEKDDREGLTSFIAMLRFLCRAIIYRLSILRLSEKKAGLQELILPLMCAKKFDDFLSLASDSFEQLLGFESCIILLINHRMKAFFVNQFKEYERESYDHELEEAKTKAQYEIKKQKKNLSKLLLGVGLTSKCLKTRDYMIFDKPEEQEYAQEVDKIKITRTLRNMIVIPFYPTPNSTLPIGILQCCNLKSHIHIGEYQIEMVKALRGFLAGCAESINANHLYNLSQL